MGRRKWHCLAWLSAAVILALGWPARSADRAATRPATRPAATAPAGKVQVDLKARTVTIPAVVASQGKYDVLKGAIEYVLVAEGGKDYETLFVTRAAAQQIYQGLAKIGLTPGRAAGANAPPRGKPVEVLAAYELKGKTHRRAVDEFVLRTQTGKPLKPRPWVFTGSAETVDPNTNEKVLQASLTHSLVGLHYTDASPLFQNPRPEARTENIYKANVKELPPAGTAVRIVFRRVTPKLPAGVRRVHAFISGRVQGVGFRAFTQHQGRLLKLTGWVRNLPDGRVEAVIEGPGKDVEKLLAKLKRGPRPARVKKLQAKDEPPEGDLRGFAVRY